MSYLNESNKTILRITFLIILFYVVMIYISNDITSYKELKSSTYIRCEKTSLENYCLNPFYDEYCQVNNNDYGNTCNKEFIGIGVCLDLKGNVINCPKEMNIYYETGFLMIILILITGLCYNDMFVRYKRKKNVN